MKDVYSYTPKQIWAMWEAYQSAPDEVTVAELREKMDAAADAVDQRPVSAVVENLMQINRNILDEASRIGDTGAFYHSLLGEAAGVRMALRLVREAAESCACEWNPACPEHGITG